MTVFRDTTLHLGPCCPETKPDHQHPNHLPPSVGTFTTGLLGLSLVVGIRWKLSFQPRRKSRCQSASLDPTGHVHAAPLKGLCVNLWQVKVSCFWFIIVTWHLAVTEEIGFAVCAAGILSINCPGWNQCWLKLGVEMSWGHCGQGLLLRAVWQGNRRLERCKVLTNKSRPIKIQHLRDVTESLSY